jgi:hypothetical protein
MIHKALSDAIFLTQKTAWISRPRPFLFVTEFDHLFANRTDIPVFKDTPVLGGDVGYDDRFFLIR